jgi:hypothetical protein
MPKVYLLLRNNYQSGPFTIEELGQQKLRPSDLLWVEGESLAWSYPMELDEVKTMMTPVSPRVPGDRIAVDSTARDVAAPPVGEIERRAEELRQRALTYVPHYSFQRRSVQADPYNPIFPEEKDKVEFIVHKRKSSISLNHLVAACLLTALIGFGWMKGGSMFQAKSGVQAQAVPFSNKTSVVKQASAQPAESFVGTTPMQDQPVVLQAGLVPAVKQKSVKAVITQPEQNKVESSAENAAYVETQPAPATIQESVARREPEPVPAIEREEKKETGNSGSAITAQAEPEEKKRGFLKGLFKKKKRDELKEESL